MYDKLIFEISKEGRPPYSLNERGGICEVPGRDAAQLIPGEFLADEEVELPMVGELDLVRHYTHLSRKNYGVDTHFYPLGSCTMKYNPKVNERVSRFRGFTEIHPYADENLVQGALEVLYYTDYYLSRITGMSGFTLQPAAGAHGELTGILLVKAYFDDIGEAGISRKKILIPDSAHGTNPASAVLGGFEVEEIKSDSRGNVDLAHLKEKLDNTVACVMLTMPNTLGLFDENMLEISRLVHEAGALLYMDGANLNAIMGICRPAELGFDIMHINLHKTFSAPHGGGGPGSGPVGVVEKLLPFLPGPRVEKNEKTFSFFKPEKTIGRVRAFYGNFNVIVKALAYMTGLGADGIKESARTAVLNANYLKEKLKEKFFLKYDRTCLHEFVLSGIWQKEKGSTTKDIGKRLLDYGFYAPTTYFPLIVEEALMIEPTETESRETLDEFIDAMLKIDEEIEKDSGFVNDAPHSTPVRRIDEVTAARKPVLKWEKE